MNASRKAVWFIGIAMVWIARPGPVLAQYSLERPPLRIGRIIIVGNTITQDRVIRQVISLVPGDVLRYPELRLAEHSLRRLGIFLLDPATGERPTVEAIPTEDPAVSDIVVRVEEAASTGSVTCGFGYNTRGRIMLSLHIEERNFDPRRWPTSFKNLAERRAFRGAGQRLRLKLTLGSLSRQRNHSKGE